MIPTSIPDRFKRLRPWAKEQRIGPPTGFTEDQVGAVEAHIDRSAPLTPDRQIGQCIRIYLDLDDDEVELVKTGNAIVELSIWGDHLHPFQLEVYERELDDEGAA